MRLEPEPRAPTISVVVPVLNEEAAIGPVVRAVPRDLNPEIVVVDGGSRDRTVAEARAAGARVVVETRRGYGRACATGATASAGEIVVFLDGDGSDDASALPLLTGPIARGEADLTLGARTWQEAGALPLTARAGNVVAAALISVLWGQRVSDLPSFKALRRSDLVALGMTEATYGWTTELIVKAARRGLRLREVPLRYQRRRGGESKVSGNLTASTKAAIAILRVLARHGFSRNGAAPANLPRLVE